MGSALCWQLCVAGEIVSQSRAVPLAHSAAPFPVQGDHREAQTLGKSWASSPLCWGERCRQHCPNPSSPFPTLLLQDRLGAGTYNIKDFLQETRPTSIRGICDTRDERFRGAHRDCFPGPGTYGNPYIPLDERGKRSASTKGMMDSRTAKCALMEAVGRGLGPGTSSLRSSIGQGLQRAGSPRPCQRVSGGELKQALEQKQKKGPEVVTVRSFLDELVSNKNKTKGCFSTLPRDTGCPTERIFWFTLSQCPRKNVMGPGSYNPKPIEKSARNSQVPSWSTAKRFNRNFYHLFTGNEGSSNKRSPQGTPATRSPTNKAGNQGTVLRLAPARQGAMVPTQQKAMAAPSSAPTMAEAAALAELRPGHEQALPGFAPLTSPTLPVDGEAHEIFSFQNPVGAGRYDTPKHEKYPRRYQSLYQCDAQWYLSNLKRDAYLLERLKPVAKTNWCDLISAPRCPDTSEEITFPKVSWCWKAQISE
ncbi:LOW QUALITY PROTEIN: ciliary microtubule-associated protein 2 [Guaruba guarouba]